MPSVIQILGQRLLVSMLCALLLAPAASARGDWQQDIKQGHEAMMQGNYKQALNLLDRALAENPNAWEAYLKRAQVYAKMGNHAATIQNYNQVTTLNPRLATVWLDRYDYFMAKNMPQQAEYDLTEGLRLLPASPELNYAYAVHLLKKGDKATALRVLQTLQSLQPAMMMQTPTEMNATFIKGSALRAQLYAESQSLGAYGQELSFLINAQPQAAKLYWKRALWHKNYANDLASAKSDLNSYLYLEPKDAMAYAMRGQINLAGNLCKDALTDLKMACKLGDAKACYRKAPCALPPEKPKASDAAGAVASPVASPGNAGTPGKTP
jgi:tetratricopeptide (TPR) repeat protein